MTDNRPRITNFAQKKGYLIQDRDFINHLNSSVDKLYNINRKTGNKFYKFLEEKDLTIIKKFRHLVCLNLNQKPTFLFLTTYKGQKYCLYFDTERDTYYSVKHRFADKLFTDTIFEGELIKVSQTHYIYLISDLIVFNGTPCTESLETKLSTIRKTLSESFKSDPGLDMCQIILKDFVDYRFIRSLVNSRNILPYQHFVSGIIFRPIEKSNKNIIVVLNRHDFHKIKIDTDVTRIEPAATPAVSVPETTKKEKERLSIDVDRHPNVVFEIRKIDKPDVYELYLGDLHFGTAAIPTLQCSKMVLDWFQKSANRSVYAVCNYKRSFRKWYPISLSSQKKSDCYDAIKHTDARELHADSGRVPRMRIAAA